MKPIPKQESSSFRTDPLGAPSSRRGSRKPYRGQCLLITLVTAIALCMAGFGSASLERRVLATTGKAVSFVVADIADTLDLGLPSMVLSLSGQPGFVEEEHRRRGVPIRAMFWKAEMAGGLVVVLLLSMLLWTARRVRQEWTHAQRERERARTHEQHLQAILTTIPECVMVVSREGVVRDVNQAACLLFDVPAATELIGKPILPLILAEDRPIFQGLHQLVNKGRPGLLQCRVSRLPNVWRWVEVSASCLRDNREVVHAVLYVLRDITEHKRAEWRLVGQHEVTRVLAEADSLVAAAPGLLRAICTGLDWAVGVLWEVDRRAGVLRCTEIWRYTPEVMERFVEVSRAVSFAPGVGLPGRVWATGRAVWIPDVAREENFPRQETAVHDDLHAAVAFPILLDGEILGVMEFFSPMIRHPDSNTLSTVSALGVQIGTFVRRKRAQEREAGFGRILDDTLNEIYLFDAESLRFLHMNRGARTNLGYTLDELLRLTPLDLMPEFTKDSFSLLTRSLGGGERKSLQFEAEHRRKDGSGYPVQVHLQSGSFGAREVFVAIVLDITEQRRAQRRLACQHAVARVLADSSSAAQALPAILEAVCTGLKGDLGLLWQVDRARKVLHCTEVWRKSPALFHRFVEASRQDACGAGIGLPGRVWARGEPFCIPDLSKEPACGRTASALADGLHMACAVPIWLRGDVYAVMECIGREPQHLEVDFLRMLGTIGSQVGLFIERIEVEAALRDNEERTRLIIDTALEAVITMDTDGTITEWNAQAETMFGWSHGEAVGQNLAALIVPLQHRESHTRGLARYLETGDGPILNKLIEMTALRRDGREFPVELAITPLQLEGSVIFSAFIRDITARKESEQALAAYAKQLERINQDLDVALAQAKAATEAKSVFLATMSHEIRTPMNGVIGMTGLLLETELTPEQREYAETVRISGEHLLTIINDILDFSKIEAGKLALEIIDFDLRNAMEECLDLFTERASAKGLNLACLFRAEVPTALRGDPGRLRQIVTNLVGNAIKFTQRGDVVLHVKLVEERTDRVVVRFEVADTGVGIAPEARARLFQSFSQADASTTRKYGGTGLGLAICKRLVELMEGEIGVDSESGTGSCFWFTATLGQQPVERRPHPVPRADLRGLRALVVDDKEINRRVLELYLNKWGLHGTIADSGESALGLLRESVTCARPYDLAILDLDMAVMDGLQVAHTINEDPALRGIRVVLLSSAGRRGDAKAAVAAGVAGYLTKPVRESHLYDCLAAVMGTRPKLEHGTGEGMPVAQSGLLVTRHSLAEAKLKAGIRLLLAEDNIINQKVAVRMLEKMGYRVDAVANGAEAVEATARISYSAVLMDCQMPDMDGFEATRRIREREAPHPSRLPIIAMTANAMKGDRERCLEAGMDDYIAKPVSRQNLEPVLARWVAPGQPSIQDDGAHRHDTRGKTGTR